MYPEVGKFDWFIVNVCPVVKPVRFILPFVPKSSVKSPIFHAVGDGCDPVVPVWVNIKNLLAVYPLFKCLNSLLKNLTVTF